MYIYDEQNTNRHSLRKNECQFSWSILISRPIATLRRYERTTLRDSKARGPYGALNRRDDTQLFIESNIFPLLKFVEGNGERRDHLFSALLKGQRFDKEIRTAKSLPLALLFNKKMWILKRGHWKIMHICAKYYCAFRLMMLCLKFNIVQVYEVLIFKKKTEVLVKLGCMYFSKIVCRVVSLCVSTCLCQMMSGGQLGRRVKENFDTSIWGNHKVKADASEKFVRSTTLSSSYLPRRRLLECLISSSAKFHVTMVNEVYIAIVIRWRWLCLSVHTRLKDDNINAENSKEK